MSKNISKKWSLLISTFAFSALAFSALAISTETTAKGACDGVKSQWEANSKVQKCELSPLKAKNGKCLLVTRCPLTKKVCKQVCTKTETKLKKSTWIKNPSDVNNLTIEDLTKKD